MNIGWNERASFLGGNSKGFAIGVESDRVSRMMIAFVGELMEICLHRTGIICFTVDDNHPQNRCIFGFDCYHDLSRV